MKNFDYFEKISNIKSKIYEEACNFMKKEEIKESIKKDQQDEMQSEF